MTQLEQLLIIVRKEMKSKQLLMDIDGNDNKKYYSGVLSALTYIKHVIERLINESK
jgi:hypothetical protein